MDIHIDCFIRSRFHVSVLIGSDYSPDELTVRTVDRKLYLLARHDEGDHDVDRPSPSSSSLSRELSREFELPVGVDPETVTASLTDDGQLIIEAPLTTNNNNNNNSI